MTRRAATLLSTLAIALLATPAAAQDAKAPDTAAAPAKDPGIGELRIGLGVGQVDEDFFLSLQLGASFGFPVPKVACYGIIPPPIDERPEDADCTTRLRFGVLVPLRLRIYDRDPETDALIRHEDWDEVSDWLRIARFVEYGRPREPVYARVGELAGVTLGHGTIVNGYFNVVDVDHFQWGLSGALNDRYGGVELLWDNLVDPSILGTRLYTYPVRFFAPSSFWTRWATGLTLALDIDAPQRFQRVDVSLDPNLPYVVTDDNNLVPEKTDVTGVLGFDQELLLVQEPLIDFIPYFDLNFHLDGSAGIHLGAFTNLRPLDELHANTRLELRWLGEHYLPDYFGALYEIERNTYFGFGGLGDPKRVVLDQLSQGQVLGAYGQIGLQVFQTLEVTGAYEDYEGPRNAAIQLTGRLTDLGPFRLGATYRRAGFNGLSDAFALDNALLIGELQVQLSPLFFVGGTYSRLYRLQDSGEYKTVDDWSVGGGVSIAF